MERRFSSGRSPAVDGQSPSCSDLQRRSNSICEITQLTECQTPNVSDSHREGVKGIVLPGEHCARQDGLDVAATHHTLSPRAESRGRKAPLAAISGEQGALGTSSAGAGSYKQSRY